jgi:hypothetical protein
VELRSFPKLRKPVTKSMGFKVCMAVAIGVGGPAGVLLENPTWWTLTSIGLGGVGTYLVFLKAGCFLPDLQNIANKSEIASL